MSMFKQLLPYLALCADALAKPASTSGAPTSDCITVLQVDNAIPVSLACSKSARRPFEIRIIHRQFFPHRDVTQRNVETVGVLRIIGRNIGRIAVIDEARIVEAQDDAPHI